MSTTTTHVSAAKTIAAEVEADYADEGLEAADRIALAQVHATLALVEATNFAAAYAHQQNAEQRAYGHAKAWDEGFTARGIEARKQREDSDYPITRDNPYRSE